jgi:hypothetical protein
MPQVSYLLRARRIGGLQVQKKPEAVEVPFDIIVAWVPFLKRQLGGKLLLRTRLEPGWDCCDPDLRALNVKITAETLEMSAKVQHKTT